MAQTNIGEGIYSKLDGVGGFSLRTQTQRNKIDKNTGDSLLNNASGPNVVQETGVNLVLLADGDDPEASLAHGKGDTALMFTFCNKYEVDSTGSTGKRHNKVVVNTDMRTENISPDGGFYQIRSDNRGVNPYKSEKDANGNIKEYYDSSDSGFIKNLWDIGKPYLPYSYIYTTQLTGSNYWGGIELAASSNTEGQRKLKYDEGGSLYPAKGVNCLGKTGGKHFYKTYSESLYGNGTNLWLSGTDSPASNIGYITISKDGYLYPSAAGGYSLGTSTKPFFALYSQNGVNPTSDRRKKENIKYINSDTEANLKLDDCFNFVKNDLDLATYKFKESDDKSNNENLGFIAQDVQKTKLGSLIVQDGETLTYSLNNYVNVLAGALQKSLKKIDVLEKDLKELKTKVK